MFEQIDVSQNWFTPFLIYIAHYMDSNIDFNTYYSDFENIAWHDYRESTALNTLHFLNLKDKRKVHEGVYVHKALHEKLPEEIA